MKLPDLTEPLFQYVCRLNRVARKGASIEYEAVRSEVRDLFSKMAEASKSDHRLAGQYQRVELPLIFFVDSLISESRLHFASEWNDNRLAFERQELAGDERFYELLEETMADRGDDAPERLVVYYTCLGVGFSGWYSGQPDVLRRKMMEMAPRIRTFVESDDAARICPEAYEHTNTANLPLPVGTRLIGIGILFVGLILVVVVANIYLFRTSSAELRRALDTVTAHDPASITAPR
jgi:type VI protein secretion system component VasF